MQLTVTSGRQGDRGGLVAPTDGATFARSSGDNVGGSVSLAPGSWETIGIGSGGDV
jgi:hypothetical protein